MPNASAMIAQCLKIYKNSHFTISFFDLNFTAKNQLAQKLKYVKNETFLGGFQTL